MLTKDLIRCRLERGRLKPNFISTDDPVALALAADILAPYRLPDGPRRSEIDEMTEPVIKGAQDLIFAKGLKKIIDDQAEFAAGGEIDYPSERRRLFVLAAGILREPARLGEDEYRQRLTAAAAGHPLLAEDSLYADLPENDRLRAFHDLTPRQLLERYNCSLVQGLLLRAGQMDLVVHAGDASRLRRLFKYLKFFRLLCRLYQDEDGEAVNPAVDKIRVAIEGPAGIFAESKRYGLQLACFFPAVCAMPRWRIRAELEWKGQCRELLLDESSGLVSHYHHFTAYVPDEIQLFHRHFAETVTAWKIVTHTPFLAGPGNELIFPDLSFENSAAELYHLELFHRWHAGPLQERLCYLDQRSELPLLIGVDRALCKQHPDLQKQLEQRPWFASRGFLFRDYPTVEKTLKCLENARKLAAASGADTQKTHNGGAAFQ